MGQTPACTSSMNSRDGVKLNGLWFIFCAKSIRRGEEKRGEVSCIVWGTVRVWCRPSRVDRFSDLYCLGKNGNFVAILLLLQSGNYLELFSH